VQLSRASGQTKLSDNSGWYGRARLRKALAVQLSEKQECCLLSYLKTRFPPSICVKKISKGIFTASL
jgi:hypothetical protein